MHPIELGGTGMEQGKRPDWVRAQQQQIADMHEDLEVRHWSVAFPLHAELREVVDHAARRAASLARLENALGRLS